MSDGAYGFASGFARGVAQSAATAQRMREQKVDFAMRQFLGQKDAYLQAQQDDMEMIEQAKSIANNFGQTDLDPEVLWVNAYNLLKTGISADNVIEQIQLGTFSPQGDDFVDASESSMRGANGLPTGPNPAATQDVAAGMRNTVEQMDALNLDNDALWQRVLNQESGSNQFDADGNLLQSSPSNPNKKPAFGIAQVQVATAMDPGFGVPSIFDMARDMDIPVAVESEEFALELLGNEQLNEKFGRAYFDAMINNYGDREKALVAYNYGAKYADNYSGDRSTLPRETRDYLNNILGNAGGATAPSSVAQADTGQDQGLMNPPPAEEPRTLFGRIFSGIGKRLKQDEDAIRQQAIKTLGISEEEYARFTSGYMSSAASAKGYRFSPYRKEADLPDWAKLSSVTAGNVDGKIAAAERALEDGNTDAAGALTYLRTLKSGYEDDPEWMDVSNTTASNYVAHRVAVEAALASETDDVKRDELNTLLSQYDEWEEQDAARQEGQDYLGGLTVDNWDLRVLQAERAGDTQAVNDILAWITNEWSELPEDKVTEEWIAATQAGYEQRLANARNSDLPQALIDQFEGQLENWETQVKPIARRAVVPAAGDAPTPIEELDRATAQYRLELHEDGITVLPEEDVQKLEVRIESLDSAALAEAQLANRGSVETYLINDGGVNSLALHTAGAEEYVPEVGTVVRKVSNDELDNITRVGTAIDDNIQEYNVARSAFIDVLDPGMEALDILNSPEGAGILTTVGGSIPRILGRLNNELDALRGITSTLELRNRLQDSGYLTDEETILGKATRLSRSADAAQRFESKILLMAYRIGAAEGQTGQGMSNKDFDRFLAIIQNSTDPVTFQRTLLSFIQEKERGTNRLAKSVENNSQVQMMRQLYDGNPMLNSFKMPTIESGFEGIENSAYTRYQNYLSGTPQQVEQPGTPDSSSTGPQSFTLDQLMQITEPVEILVTQQLIDEMEEAGFPPLMHDSGRPMKEGDTFTPKFGQGN